MYEYAHKIISHGNQEKKVILVNKKLVRVSINQEFWLMIRSLRAAAGWSWGLIEATKPTSSLSTPSAHWSFEMCLIFFEMFEEIMSKNLLFRTNIEILNMSENSFIHLSSDTFYTTSHTSVM